MKSAHKRHGNSLRRSGTLPEEITLLFAEPYSESGAKKRREIVLQRDPSIPKYVYHLYTSLQEDERLPPIIQFRRTYAQYELANQDALSWVLEQHRIRGSDSYLEDTDYSTQSEGKCAMFSTSPADSEKWCCSYSSWTVEDLLY